MIFKIKKIGLKPLITRLTKLQVMLKINEWVLFFENSVKRVFLAQGEKNFEPSWGRDSTQNTTITAAVCLNKVDHIQM